MNAVAEFALRDERCTLTKAEVTDLLNRATNGLLGMDLGPDRRIAVFAENSAETALVYAAGLLAGCCVVPVGFHLTADEVAYILSDSGSQLILAGPETVDRAVVAGEKAGVDALIAWRVEGDGSSFGEEVSLTSGASVIAWEAWLAEQPAAEPRRDIAPRPMLSYTSGTTGFPKGVEQPPAIFVGGETMAEHLERLDAHMLNAFASHLVVGPLYHAGPQSAVRALAVGRSVTVLGRFDAEATLAAIDRDRPQMMVLVPAHYQRLLALPEEVRARYDVSSLKLVAQTGAACPVPVKRAMIDWFGPVFIEAYGATEAGTVAMITADEWLEHPGSVGRAVPPFEALVLDEDGQPVPPMTEGRLFFRDTTGRGIVYHGDPAKTAEAHVAPGVFTIGEIGYVDEDGYIFITDRFSDMVVSGGVNVYPAEAERVLLEHPAVADVIAIGVPNEDLGEELKALVALTPGAEVSAEELIAFCRNGLAHFKCPRTVDFIDSVPRDALGKPAKRTLRAAYWPTDRTIG